MSTLPLLGVDSIDSVHHGINKISHAYLGTDLVYQAAQPIPPSSWTPSQLTGLQCWLDAADGDSIYDNDQGKIGQWLDKSGNDHNFSQSLVTQQPIHDGTSAVTFTGGERLSNNTIEFDDDYIWGDSSTGHTVFVVARSTGDNVSRLLCSSVEPRFLFGGGVAEGDNNFMVAYGNNSRYNSINVLTPTTSLDSTNILSVVNTQDTQTTPYVNGVALNQIDGHMGAFTGLVIGAGNYSTIDGTWSGEVNEIVIFDLQLSSQDREKMEGYLAYKWSLQDLLPENHTHKILPPY